MSEPESLLASIDLGSNSFHMVVAREEDGQLQVIDRLVEPVRLAQGLDAKGKLAKDAQQRALECLSRFGQRLASFPSGNVRAVGTNTLRKAQTDNNFLQAAEEALGHSIDIISGVEEARLIHKGVAAHLPERDKPHMIMDIGGGSTEVIIGKGHKPLYMESLYMGCVSYSNQFFPKGKITEANMNRAIMAAQLELRPVKSRFLEREWEVCIGSSGTMKAVERILAANQFDNDGITRKGLTQLREYCIDAGHVDKLCLNGLSSRRAAVLPGGIAIIEALFDSLNLKKLAVSEYALREGLLLDLIGRIHHDDIRDRAVAAMMQRFEVDQKQASRVEAVAQHLLEQAAEGWRLKKERYESLLNWAARLHEVGLAIAHDRYHKHGAYLVENADLPGFTRQEQQMLAALIRNHRRKLSQSALKSLSPKLADKLVRLTVLLRLAVLFYRSRDDIELPQLQVKAKEGAINLRFPPGWLNDHPLTQADLEQERDYLQAIGVGLDFK